MCLVLNKEGTEEFLNANKGQKITGYKVLHYTGKQLESIYYHGVYKPGVVESGRMSKNFMHDETDQTDGRTRVEHGIHVCLTLEEAHKVVEYEGGDDLAILEVEFEADDVVGIGGWGDFDQRNDTAREQAVVTKINVTQGAYDDALAQCTRLSVVWGR